MLEREVRSNLVYRQFTRVGAAKVPDAKTLGKLGIAIGPEIIEQVHQRVVSAFDAFREACRFSLLPRLGAGVIDAAEDLALKFSIELDASASLDAKARRRFVRAIYNCLHRSDPQAQTRVVSPQVALLFALESYSVTGGLDGLISIIEAAYAIH